MQSPRRKLKRMFIILTTLIVSLFIATILYMHLPKFGKAPTGKRLERIKQSPNYKNGKFQNTHPTAIIVDGYSMTGEIYKTLFQNNPGKRPVDNIPSIKTNLHTIPLDTNVLIWFGHSSYFMQVDGIRFLIDPVFSGSASPLPNGTRSFKGTDVYTVNDFPDIDYLLISHDHYDHLDYKTITELKHKVKYVICGLGVGEHFEYWGYDPLKIIEKDWNETIMVNDSFNIHTATARHGSGRTFKNNNTLWLSFIIDAPTLKIYLGGDGGYGTHFSEIGNKYGPFDFAVLENGQYNVAWKNIHLLPEDFIRAATDLQVKRVLPVHSSKFVLARHPWNEPLERVEALSKSAGLSLLTPMIGEKVDLKDSAQPFTHWWKEVN